MPISAAKLPLRQPSSMMTARRVLATEAMMVASSSGRKAAQIDHLGLDVVGGKRGRRLERLP